MLFRSNQTPSLAIQMIDFIYRPVCLIALCAVAYAGATFAMKSASIAPTGGIWLIIGMALGLAVLAEIALLRQHSLGLTYITILGAETLIVLTVAFLIGEGLGPRELAGAGLVLAGTAVIWS